MSSIWGFGKNGKSWWCFCHPNLTYDTFLESLGTGQCTGSIFITMMIIMNINFFYISDISYVKLRWQKSHQYTQFPPKSHLEDIPDLSGHPDGIHDA